MVVKILSALVPRSSYTPPKSADRAILHGSSNGPPAPGLDGAEVVLVSRVSHVGLPLSDWSDCWVFMVMSLVTIRHVPCTVLLTLAVHTLSTVLGTLQGSATNGR